MADTRWLDEEEQRTWRAYIRMSQLLQEALERQLQRDSGMPHAYYMILVVLSESPGRVLTMTGLADLLQYSASRLSHAISRLEEKGWVRRVKRDGDRRTTMAELTGEGFAALAAAAPGHVAEVRRVLFDPLTRAEMHEFRALLDKIFQGFEGSGEAVPPAPPASPPPPPAREDAPADGAG
ncbi:MarR family transcriptional regulator [Microbispora sp. RL4-1S]|uniref:MarR family transcriptional regulator n=1 Tax=Microbispora oryzae TaxID=2806554 RepID=A0A940WQI0_9ACTN|nr:MarR family transcriptional regulator [Microbispora oryzae]MBP2708092.1 MarR family transcriptional regulator [Microbispora oryzae]